MDIRIKEPLYIKQGEQEYSVRPGSVGVDRNKVIFFYDVTKTVAVGVSRDFCLENPHIFQVARTLSDKEVSVKDVLTVINSHKEETDPRLLTRIINEITAL